MSAEKQYIDLYRSQKDLINAHSAPALNALREEAARQLGCLGLQRPHDFSHVDPEQLLAADYSLNLARHMVPLGQEGPFTCTVPELSTNVHFLTNEQYTGTTDKVADDSYYAGSLREFAVSHPEVMQQYYNRLAGSRLDTGDPRSAGYTACSPGESALNTMLCQDGFVLYVPDGVQVKRPLQLISLLRSVEDFLAVQRLLVIIGKHASASLLVCEHASLLPKTAEDGQPLVQTETDGRAAYVYPDLLSLQTTEIFVEEDASLQFYSLQDHHAHAHRLGQIYLYQQRGSEVDLGQYALNVGQTRNRVQVALDGPGAQVRLYGMATLDAAQRLDNITFVDHRVPDCQSSELFRYTLDGQAKGSFLGRILVRKGSDRTDASQTSRNLCLSPEARMIARPELEIYADDVKCSHGATVGQLDRQALFYMCTRGIPEEEARMLLKFAFMADVIEGIRIEPLKVRLKSLVEKRFRGELERQCRSCSNTII